MSNNLKHIGFIVDGNRRWAKARGLPTLDGHKRGFKVLKQIVKYCFEQKIEFVSAYIFSTENWSRSAEEVGYLMRLFEIGFKKELKDLHEGNIKVVFSGSREYKVSQKLLEIINQAEEMTKNNTGGTLCLCFNYGGRLEIADAVKKIAQKIQNKDIDIADITPDMISENIYNPEIPDVDLMVRTSGEQRISNFQLWRIAYAEMAFLQKCWPDMEPEDVDKLIEEYSHRDRRMGGDSK